MSQPGPLLARGRSADVFDLGGGTVLRRRRGGPIPQSEVVAMRAAHRNGYPVPEVFDVDGADMVMERVDGTDYLSLLTRRPWRARQVGRILAELHNRLLDVPIEGLGLAAHAEPAEALVHGDLHPGNVLASPEGPVVIDWENAGTGPRDGEVASTWLVLSIGDPDDVPAPVCALVSTIRRSLISSFMAGVDRPSPATIVRVCELRLDDPNLSAAEKDRIREIGAAHAR
jgi:serine/threonine protein kinase